MKKHLAIILATTVIVTILWALIDETTESSEIDNNARYTIGTTLNFYLTAAGGRGVNYKYSVDGTTYENSSPYQYEAKVPNGKYLVKFSSLNPDKSRIFLNVELPPETKPPSSGWKTRPR